MRASSDANRADYPARPFRLGEHERERAERERRDRQRGFHCAVLPACEATGADTVAVTVTFEGTPSRNSIRSLFEVAIASIIGK